MELSNWLPPINLFSVPRQEKICRHTHWLRLPSIRQKWCYDCKAKRDINNDMPVHTR